MSGGRSGKEDLGPEARVAQQYALRLALATCIVGGFVGTSLALRAQRLQVRRIRRTLRRRIVDPDEDRPFRLPIMTPLANALKERFKQSPRAPLIVTGPEGVGKATLLHYAMREQQLKGCMAMYLSLSREPVRAGDSFVRLFVDRSGFLVSPTDSILMRSLLRTKPEKQRITEKDFLEASKAIEVTLDQERLSGWPRGVPILCIEEMHERRHEMIDMRNPLVGRFLEWCSHLCLNRLAHVVFVTSIRAAMMLEKEAGLQLVRDIMYVDFPNENRIRQVLEKTGAGLKEVEKDLIVERLGGDVRDLIKVIYAVQRGTPVTLAVEERIVEAVQLVERQINPLVSAILKDEDLNALQQAAGCFCRIWKLMEMFSEKAKIQRSSLIGGVFGVHLGELTKYVERGLLTYTLPRSKKRLVGESRRQARFPRTVWPDEYVTVGSPCVQDAFVRILGMAHYCRAHDLARAIVERSVLHEQERELARLSKSVETQANSAFRKADLLSKNSKEWGDLYGDGGGAHIAKTWRHAYQRAVTCGMKHESFEDDLMAVQMRQRALQNTIDELLLRPRDEADVARQVRVKELRTPRADFDSGTASHEAGKANQEVGGARLMYAGSTPFLR